MSEQLTIRPPEAIEPRAEPLPQNFPKDVIDDPEALDRIRRILASPSYSLAEDDRELLARDEMRSVRLLLEYQKPQLAFQQHEIRSTIVLFGGTRIVEPSCARRRLEEAVKARDASPDQTELERRVRVAQRILAKSHYYDVARAFGRLIGEVSRRGDGNEYVIVTGGGPGIMEAGNRGAFDAGAKTIGLNITLPLEQYPNPYITPELCFQFHYFALRKMHFLKLAAALVAFPGGYGTLDELFDALCLIQTRKMPAVPIVLVGESFWRGAFDAEFLLDEGVIAPEDLALFSYAETAEDIRDRILGFYGRD